MTAKEINDQMAECHDSYIANLDRQIEEFKQVILDCWELLQVKPRQKSQWLSTRLRNEELIENQEELINQLRETLEPIVNKIQTELEEPECDPNDNGKDPDSSNDDNDLEDYNEDEIATNDDPQENTN